MRPTATVGLSGNAYCAWSGNNNLKIVFKGGGMQLPPIL